MVSLQRFNWLPTLTLCLMLAGACKNKKQEVVPVTGGNPEIARLSQLLKDNPNNDSLYYQRGVAFWELEAYDEAIGDATRAISIDSLKPGYYQLLADVLIDYRRPNDSKRAIEVMKKACDKFPDDLPTWLRLSEIYLIVRQHGEAFKTLDHVLKRDPQNATAFFTTGRVALDMGDTTRCIKSLQKSVLLNADNKDAWIFLGRLYSNRGNILAIQYFDNALRIDSTDVEVMEFKAAHYKRVGQFDQAFKLYREIITNHPDYSNAFFDMGLIYLEMDSLDKAWWNFDMAVKTDPLFVIAYHYRGVASEEKGNMKAAIDDYKQANRMSPNLPEPKAALERLNIAE
jgi:tetratricopeptide (TPR) repeat protein